MRTRQGGCSQTFEGSNGYAIDGPAIPHHPHRILPYASICACCIVHQTHNGPTQARWVRECAGYYCSTLPSMANDVALRIINMHDILFYMSSRFASLVLKHYCIARCLFSIQRLIQHIVKCAHSSGNFGAIPGE